ncbi:hypothetical protein B0H10DRAFT_1778197, partial [Mycena sp. CBHHK59/15]
RSIPRRLMYCSSEPAKAYTVDAKNTLVLCIRVHKSYILQTGTLGASSQSQRDNSIGTTSCKMKMFHQNCGSATPPGSIIVPGLSNAHAHLLEYRASRQLALEGTKAISETVARVREYILANLDVYSISANASIWIFGSGWDQTVWPTARWPTAADLDSDLILRGRPTVPQSKDCPAIWVSGKAVEVRLPFPDVVEGGVIVCDEYGHPVWPFP